MINFMDQFERPSQSASQITGGTDFSFFLTRKSVVPVMRWPYYHRLLRQKTAKYNRKTKIHTITHKNTRQNYTKVHNNKRWNKTIINIINLCIRLHV